MQIVCCCNLHLQPKKRDERRAWEQHRSRICQLSNGENSFPILASIESWAKHIWNCSICLSTDSILHSANRVKCLCFFLLNRNLHFACSFIRLAGIAVKMCSHHVYLQCSLCHLSEFKTIGYSSFALLFFCVCACVFRFIRKSNTISNKFCCERTKPNESNWSCSCRSDMCQKHEKPATYLHLFLR